VESLLSLAEMMTEYDVAHSDILDVLRPSGPRIDPVVDLMTRLVAQSQDETQPTPKSPLVETSQQDKTQPLPGEHSKTGEVVCWLTPVKSSDDETAEECIERLVGKGHYYAFGKRTAGRRHMKAGDSIAFYATTKGVVAHATLSSPPQEKQRPEGSAFPWVCSLKDALLYLDTPVAIDAKLRQQLDAFKGRNPEQGWAWFVQATRKVSLRDYGLLTGKTQ
jgi:hypothetical protein